jgi:hypothetical protein
VLAECRALEIKAKTIAADAAARQSDLVAHERSRSEAAAAITQLTRAREAIQLDPQELQACEDGRDLARELSLDRAETAAADARIREATHALAEHGNGPRPDGWTRCAR